VAAARLTDDEVAAVARTAAVCCLATGDSFVLELPLLRSSGFTSFSMSFSTSFSTVAEHGDSCNRQTVVYQQEPQKQQMFLWPTSKKTKTAGNDGYGILADQE
jgi:hypothetical protein